MTIRDMIEARELLAASPLPMAAMAVLELDEELVCMGWFKHEREGWSQDRRSDGTAERETWPHWPPPQRKGNT